MKKMQYQKMFLLTLSLALIMGLSLTQLFAQNPPQNVTYNQSTKTYEVKSVDNMHAVADAVNNGWNSLGYTFKLMADIGDTINPVKIPIGSFRPFKGTFDGDGWVVTVDYSNIGISVSSNSYVGLFGYTENAIISNVTVKGKLGGNNCVGGVVGRGLNTTIINCSNFAYLKCDDITVVNIGGIIGFGEGRTIIKRCVNSGNIICNNSNEDNHVYYHDCYIGGIIGTARPNNRDWYNINPRINSLVIEDCLNLGTIQGKHCIGGINGYTDVGTQIERCMNGGYILGDKYM